MMTVVAPIAIAATTIDAVVDAHAMVRTPLVQALLAPDPLPGLVSADVHFSVAAELAEASHRSRQFHYGVCWHE
jgi:hypothetical protein